MRRIEAASTARLGSARKAIRPNRNRSRADRATATTVLRIPIVENQDRQGSCECWQKVWALLSRAVCAKFRRYGLGLSGRFQSRRPAVPARRRVLRSCAYVRPLADQTRLLLRLSRRICVSKFRKAKRV